ncbi:hypothetical protein D9756_010845 [Leucocoprinus leucothites]|uniref:Uncharacterized protein n=1 Tax=Leucocoprinus leucothites TaxID=201217 RepID=A0A8H5CSX4_9AGAR|nr:hypothetical protein D9756_010845 [Leucoagaricus leucothites]
MGYRRVWVITNMGYHRDNSPPAFYLIQGHSVPDPWHTQLRRHSHSLLWEQPFSQDQNYIRNHHRSLGLDPIPWATEAPAVFQDYTPLPLPNGIPPHTVYHSGNHDFFYQSVLVTAAGAVAPLF